MIGVLPMFIALFIALALLIWAAARLGRLHVIAFPIAASTAFLPLFVVSFFLSLMVLGGGVGPCGISGPVSLCFAVATIPPSVLWGLAVCSIIPAAGMMLTVALSSITSFCLLAIFGEDSISDPIRCGVVSLVWLVPQVAVGAVVVSRNQRHRSVESWACASCGYSLVGLNAQDPCPECGKARSENSSPQVR